MRIDWLNTIDNIGDYEGFIYRITHLPTGKKYIGKKSYWSRRKVAVKGKKRKKNVVKESNWCKYYSSNDWIKSEVKKNGTSDFEFDILKHCKNKRELTYYEAWYQFKYNVLESRLKNGEYEYINTNILGKFFRAYL